MQGTIYTVKIANTIDDIDGLGFFIRRKKGENLRKYLEKKLPITVKERYEKEMRFVDVILPIIANINQTLNEDYIINIINVFNNYAKAHRIKSIILDQQLKRYANYFTIKVIENNQMNELLTDSVIEKMIEQYALKEFDLKIMLITQYNEKSKYIINNLINNYKFVTIYTEDYEEYSQYALEIYEKYGVLLPIIKAGNKDEFVGNIIVDFSHATNNYFYYFNENTYVFYPNLSEIDLHRNKSNKKELNYIKLSYIYKATDFLNEDYFFAYIISHNLMVNRLVNDFKSNYNYEKLHQYLSQMCLDLVIDKV